MQTNGADVTAHLVARVAELEAAHALLCRRITHELVPRLLELERTAELVLELLSAGGTAAAELARSHTTSRRASERAQEDDDADDPD